MKNNLQLPIEKDGKVRRAIAKESHLVFFHYYFHEAIQYPTADFQKEIIDQTQENLPLLIVVAFRGSAKSTILSLSYPLWAIMGKKKKKFVVLVSQTQYQARQLLLNVKQTLENNRLLRSDFGPFVYTDTDQWNAGSLYLKDYDAKIIAISTEQSIRGIRHGSNRPDLIICDDIEDTSSVTSSELRNKKEKWFKSEIVPTGDLNTEIVMIGNLLHQDALLMRLGEELREEQRDGKFFYYPLLNDKGVALWPQKFPDEATISFLRRQVNNQVTWMREYLLKIVPDEHQVIHEDWIKYYDEIEEEEDTLRYVAIGIDLAVSLKQTADYTAIVCAKVYGYGDKKRIYIEAHPMNERLESWAIVKRAEEYVKNIGRGSAKLYVEDVGMQKGIIQQMEQKRLPVKGIPIQGQDKRARLIATAPFIKDGAILFPRKGAEALLQQLIGFGVERHDDLCDAFTLLANEVNSEKIYEPRILFVGGERRDPFFDYKPVNWWTEQF